MATYLYIVGEPMSLETVCERAAVAAQLLADDIRDGHFISAKDHLTFCAACLDELAFAQEMELS